jgi:chaperone required for assembly of F1-ATPase
VLLQRQKSEWQPIIDWYCAFHGNIDLKPSHSMAAPEISPKAREAVMRHMLSYNFNSLNGFTFGVDSSKSIILTTAAVERQISVEEAVRLTRLETDVQVSCED